MQLKACNIGLSPAFQTGTKDMLGVCGQKWSAEVTQSGQHMAKDIGLSKRRKEKTQQQNLIRFTFQACR